MKDKEEKPKDKEQAVAKSTGGHPKPPKEEK